LFALSQVVSNVQGISEIAEKVGVIRQGVEKALSDDGKPCLGNVISTMKAMGYCLVTQKLP
jgi:DNA-binding phage protein